MATCKECIHEKLCVIKAFPDAFENTEWSKKPCDHFKPTADFVPKSEVAREIFEEIEKLLITNDFEKHYGYPVIAYNHFGYAELKKKYTEDQNNENQNQT